MDHSRHRWIAIGMVVISVLTLQPLTRSATSRPHQASPASSASARPGTGLLVGQVVDGDSAEPVPDALVTIWPGSGGLMLANIIVMGTPGKWPVQIAADGTGSFVFSELPAGPYTITATKPGYIATAYGLRRPTGSAMTLQLVDGERRGDVRLLMWKYGSLGGTVLDELGDPVVGVTVRAFRRADFGGRAHWLLGNGEPPHTLSTVGTATTDDRGVYRIGRLLPGDYIVVVPSTQTTLPLSLAQAIATNDVAPGVQSEILRATLPTVTLFNPGGAPTTPPLGSPNNQVVGSSVWQVQGRSATAPAPAGDGRFFVYPSAFAPATKVASEATVAMLHSGEERSNLDIRLTLAGAVRVSGTITGPSGTVGSVALRLVPTWAEDFLNLNVDAATTVTDGNGMFTMMGVPAGTYTLRVNRPARPAASPPAPMLWTADAISVGDKDINDLRVMLRPGLHVSGRVEFEGAAPRPATGPYVYLLDAAEAVTTNWMSAPNVSADWQFTTRDVPAGKYFVRIGNGPPLAGWTFKRAMLNGRDVSDTPLELNEDLSGLVVRFTDQPIRLSGTVRTAQGATDPHATIVLFTADRQAWSAMGPSPRRLRTAEPDASGAFNVSDVPAGEYFVVAVSDRSADGSANIVRWLDTLSAVATKIQVVDGEKKTVDLRTVTVR